MANVAMVFLASLALAGCEAKKPSGEPTGRVNEAKVVTKRGNSTKAFCDVYATADTAKLLTWPAFDSTPPTSAVQTWRWINVWATWCEPCIEEMPRIARWRDKLAGAKPLEITFVSLDETAAVIEAFRKTHPEIPPSLRLAKPDKSQEWFQQLGLAGAPQIPIHIFVDPANKVRCVRAAAVRDTDYGAVAGLLSE